MTRLPKSSDAGMVRCRMPRRLSMLIACVLLAGGQIPAQTEPGSAESELRSALVQFIRAFENLDWEGFRQSFAEDVTVFYPRAFPQASQRARGIRKDLQNRVRTDSREPDCAAVPAH